MTPTDAHLTLSLCALLLVTASIAAEEGITSAAPLDTGEALVNPSMGWTLHYYSNVPTNYGSRLAPSDTVDGFPGLAVVYLRIPWAYVEPEEGAFNWSVVDGPAQRWIARGRRVAFRFSCCESWMRYATPEWVERAGAKGYNFTPGKLDETGPYWEPDYNDPVFLEKLDRFLAAAAARYDGDPTVDFVDVGSFGVWGEGHLWASTQMNYPAETVMRHIDLHTKHFRRTLLAANDDFAFQGDETIRYALEQGLTLRDDSILVQPGENAYFHAEMARDFWPTRPVILECEHYGGSRDRGNWQDGSLYLQAVEDYHASYAAIHWWPHEFLEENRDLIRRINLRLGYRIQLAEASWPTTMRVGESFPFRSVWRNAGVAPCYPGGFPAVTLRDAEGGLVTVWADEGFNVRDLAVGAPGEAPLVERTVTLTPPFYLRPGTYDVLVSVGTRTGTPTIALPHEGHDGARRYRVGTITFRGDYAVEADAIERRGDAWALPLTWTVHGPLPKGIAPFFHFVRDGVIVFQGSPDADGDVASLHEPGVHPLACVFTLPADSRDQEYEVYAGLWDPARVGQSDERMIPDSGDGERRVALGRVRVADEGVVLVAGAPPNGA